MMLQIIKDGGCNTIDPSIYPTKEGRFGDLEERQKCREYWKQAQSTILAKFSGVFKFVLEEFKKAYRIQVNDKYCYKEDLFREKGWCKIAPDIPGGPDPNQWGFCSTSCDIDFLRVTSQHLKPHF